jgi:peptide/nickel transport system substrate-binding protein
VLKKILSKASNFFVVLKQKIKLGDPRRYSQSIFHRQKELDKKLIYSLNGKKFPSFKQLRYAGSVLDKKELFLIKIFSGLIIVSFVALGAVLYFRNFEVQPNFGGEYTEALIGAPQYINPLLSQTNDVDADLSKLIFSGLMKYDADLQLIPDLAERIDITEDQLAYTFTLKEGVKWHDGEPLTAQDVAFTFESIKDPDFKSPLIVSFRGVSVEPLDDRTIRLTLPEVYPYFLEVLTVGILPQHLWGSIPPANANLTEYNLKPIGSGPWKFNSLTKDKLGNIRSIVVEQNQDYYSKKPFIEKITFKFYPDFESAVSSLTEHSTEGISFLPKDLRGSLTSQKNLKYHSFSLPQYTATFFNGSKKEALKNKQVREALALAIDKRKILDQALQLEGEIIQGPLLPVTIDQSEQRPYDPTKANELLEESGWEKISTEDYINKLNADLKPAEEETETENTEIQSGENTTPELTEEEKAMPFFRQNSKGEILSLNITTVNQTENITAANLIKDLWKELGIKTSVEVVEGNRISRDVIKPRNYEVLLFGIIVGSNADPYPFWHSSQAQDPGLNLSGLSNREVDKLLEEAKKTNEEEKLKEIYQQFQKIIESEIPAIFLYSPTYTYAVDQKVKGINLDRVVLPSDRFNNIQDWYIKTKRVFIGTIR